MKMKVQYLNFFAQSKILEGKVNKKIIQLPFAMGVNGILD